MDVSEEDLEQTWDPLELQAAGFLKAIRSDQAAGKIEAAVRRLRTDLLAVHCSTHTPEDDLYSVAERLGVGHYVRGLRRLARGHFRFKFGQPVDVHLVGSYAARVDIDDLASVDLAIEMPSSMSDQNFIGTYGYHLKTALYLVALAEQLAAHPLVGELLFLRRHDDPRKLVLQLIPKGQLKELCRFVLIAFAPAGLALDKFSPSVNHLCMEKFCSAATMNLKTKSFCSASYNQSIARDLTMVLYKELYERDVPSSCLSAVRLLRVWLRRRQLDRGYGSVSATFALMLAIHLLRRGRLHEGANLWSNFKVLLSALTNMDLDLKPISLHLPNGSASPTPPVEEFQSRFPVVFIDPTGYVNVCADWSVSTWLRLKHEAGVALNAIATLDPGSAFFGLFQVPVTFEEKFDICFRIETGDWLDQLCHSSEERFAELVDKACLCDEVIWPSMRGSLQEALGDRVVLIDKRRVDYSQVAFRDDDPFSAAPAFDVGLLMETGRQKDRLIRGPPADDAQAVRFREFWGDLSQLRKFPAFGICEAVLFDEQSEASVTQRIVTHTLCKHFNAPTQTIRCTDHAISVCLEQAIDTRKEDALTAAYDRVAKMLKMLNDLPFKVVEVSKMSSAFCHCDLYPPYRLGEGEGDDMELMRKVNVPKWNARWSSVWRRPLEIFVVVDVSGDQRKDYSSEEMKQLRIAVSVNLLKSLWSTFKCRVKRMEDKLLIVQGGFTFRISVHCRGRKTTQEEKKEERTDVLDEEQHVLKAQLIRRLAVSCGQHEALEASIRMAKRWVTCHMLSDYLRDEAIELIVLSLFLHPFPYTPPKHHVTAFLRFLRLLATHEWALFPLIINIGDHMSADQMVSIKSQFQQLRPTLPAFCLATPDDPLGVHWTRPQPCAPVADWICRLAGTAVRAVLSNDQATVFQADLLDAQVAEPPLSHFHVVIELRVDGEPDDTITAVMARGGNVRHRPLPLIDYNPIVLYVRDLRKLYGQLALFFANPWYGRYVGVIWKPHVLKAVSDGCADVQSMLRGFYLLGEGLVDSVTVMS